MLSPVKWVHKSTALPRGWEHHTRHSFTATSTWQGFRKLPLSWFRESRQDGSRRNEELKRGKDDRDGNHRRLYLSQRRGMPSASPRGCWCESGSVYCSEGPRRGSKGASDLGSGLSSNPAWEKWSRPFSFLRLSFLFHFFNLHFIQHVLECLLCARDLPGTWRCSSK